MSIAILGIVPVLIQPPSSQNVQSALPTIKVTLELSKSIAVLTTHTILRLLKSKVKILFNAHQMFIAQSSLQEAQSVGDFKNMPLLLETDDVPKKKLEKFYKAPSAELIAYIDFSVSTTGMLSGVKVTISLSQWLRLTFKHSTYQMSHSAVVNACQSHKHATELYPSREIVLCLDPYTGLGLVLWCLSG